MATKTDVARGSQTFKPRRRREARRGDSGPEAASEAQIVDQVEGGVHRQQRVKALYAALETLPDHLRVAFVLRDPKLKRRVRDLTRES